MANKKMQTMPRDLNQKHGKGGVAKAPTSIKEPPIGYELRNSQVRTKKMEIETSGYPFSQAHQERALLLLDEVGIIKYCSPAVLSGFGMQTLAGQPVTNLLPGFPIGQSASRQNLAYVLSRFRGAQWRQQLSVF